MVKNMLAVQETRGSIPGSGRSPREGNSNPLQYFCLENPMNRGAWWAILHGVTESDSTKRLTLPLSFVCVCMCVCMCVCVCLYTHICMCFPGSSVCKESACSAGDQALVSEPEDQRAKKIPWRRKCNPLQ